MARRLTQLDAEPKSVLDFGCGTGSAAPFLRELLRLEFILGVDVSSKCIDVAKQSWESKQTQFSVLEQYAPQEEFDLAFSNGTFHHIVPDQRAAALDVIYRSLRPGALFALWENNPWNPGTRYVMSRTPFDKDAITLSAPETRRLLGQAGFEIIGTDFLFIFPRSLHWLRGIEPLVSRLPLGAQYQVLCKKPPIGSTATGNAPATD